MTVATLAANNGTTSYPVTDDWLRSTARAFFSGINWNDNPPMAQELAIAASESNNPSLSLVLSVNQFFSTINWAGNVAPTPNLVASESAPTKEMDFTLDDFSELF